MAKTPTMKNLNRLAASSRRLNFLVCKYVLIRAAIDPAWSSWANYNSKDWWGPSASVINGGYTVLIWLGGDRFVFPTYHLSLSTEELTALLTAEQVAKQLNNNQL